VILLFAIGNAHRHDDGVASIAVGLLPAGDYHVRTTMELLPEYAEEVARARLVVFVDADFRPGPARLERMSADVCCPGTFTHALRPCDLLALTRRLYPFHGEAWLLRIPGVDFSPGEGLSPVAATNARTAADLLYSLLAPASGC
jgi:hydrogenase maturation protease